MRIQVDNELHVDDLLAFLRKCGCIALRADEHALAVHLPDTSSELAERLELGVYLSTWQATRPEAEATLVDQPARTFFLVNRSRRRRVQRSLHRTDNSNFRNCP